MTVSWVTGAGGFIGSHLTRMLGARGDTVGGFGRLDERASGSFVTGPIEAEQMDRLAALTGTPDAIYHLAGGSSVGASFADPALDFRRTVTTTASLLEWVRDNAPGAALVMASSAAVYGADHAGPIAKDTPTSPWSPYGYHKLAAELLCRSYAHNYGLRISIARLFSVYGPDLRKQLLWDLCGMLARDGGARLGGTGREVRDWVHVDDVVRLLAAAAERASPEVALFHGGTGRGTDIRTIAGAVARAFGVPADAVSFSGQARAGDPFSLVAVPDAGADWTVALDDGLRGYVSWFKRQAQAAA